MISPIDRMLIRRTSAMTAPMRNEDAASVPQAKDDHIAYAPAPNTAAKSRFMLTTVQPLVSAFFSACSAPLV
jgi:hypothetical protein